MIIERSIDENMRNVLIKIESKDIVDGKLYIPEGVEVIGDNAMVNRFGIGENDYEGTFFPIEGVSDVVKFIYVPSSVRKIGKRAMAYLPVLKGVYFDEDCELEEIGAGALSYCTSLEKLTLPYLSALPQDLLKGCKNFGDFNMRGGNPKYVGYDCFHGCGYLSYIQVEDNPYTEVKTDAVDYGVKIIRVPKKVNSEVIQDDADNEVKDDTIAPYSKTEDEATDGAKSEKKGVGFKVRDMFGL